MAPQRGCRLLRVFEWSLVSCGEEEFLPLLTGLRVVLQLNAEALVFEPVDRVDHRLVLLHRGV
jgi:hypothetical protein